MIYILIINARVGNMYPKIEHDPEALKRLRYAYAASQNEKLTQAKLAEKINRLFEAHGVPDGVIQKQIADWEKGTCNLGLARGLALAQILDTTFSELTHSEILRLGPLETRLLEFASAQEAGQFFLQAESEGRVVSFSGFPCPLYTALVSPQGQPPIEKTATAHKRFEQLAGNHAHTQEFYPLDKLLEFCFSLFSPFSLAEKTAALDRMLEMFSNKYNSLHLVSGSSYLNFTANLLFSRAERAIYLPLFCHTMTALEIRNVWLYERLLGLLQDFYQKNPQNFTTTAESALFISKIKVLLNSWGGKRLRQSGRFMQNVRPNCNG